MATANDHSQDHDAHDDHGHHTNYVKIWAILLVLLIISILGPMVGIQAVTIMTAFGIAVVKAYMVARFFMHVNIAPKYVTYFLVTALGFMLLFFAGVSPDVMRHKGHQWNNVAAEKSVERGLAEAHASDAEKADGKPDSKPQ